MFSRFNVLLFSAVVVGDSERKTVTSKTRKKNTNDSDETLDSNCLKRTVCFSNRKEGKEGERKSQGEEAEGVELSLSLERETKG